MHRFTQHRELAVKMPPTYSLLVVSVILLSWASMVSAARSQNVPDFLHDFAELGLQVKDAVTVTEMRQDLNDLTRAIEIPPPPGEKLVIVTLSGTAQEPCSIMLRPSHLSAVFTDGNNIGLVPAVAVARVARKTYWSNPSASAILYHFNKAGPIELKAAFVLPEKVESFVVRLPTLAGGEANVSKD